MTREEYMQKLTSIGTIEDAAERRSALTEIVDAATAAYDELDILRAANKTLDANNKKLQEYNMELFLRVGDQKKQDPIETKTEPKLTYENLFNEKGELK